MAELVYNEARLVVPVADEVPWPSLGNGVVDWMEANLVHGPGDVLGEPLVLIEEYVLFLWRAYEVFPRDHPQAGRRRWKRVVLSRRKGMAKTELGACIAIAEMDPTAPVRTVGWDENDQPIGGPVRDPFIPMVAYTEEQADELGYWSAHEILTHCELGNSYDVGLQLISHRTEPGRMQAVASAPSARDGARTTFQWFDETHLFNTDRHRRVHSTMQRNIPKRVRADAWSLETTTMYEPGEESVAQNAHEWAIEYKSGRIKAEPRMLFDHRGASMTHNLETKTGVRAAIVEASGDALEFTDVESVAGLLNDPDTNLPDFRRYWLNQRVRGESRWVSVDALRLRLKKRKVKPEAPVVLAFDGSVNRDSTALVACTIEPTPHIFVVNKWIKPARAKDWRVPRGDVLEAVEEAMESRRYDVRELAPDPHHWGVEVEGWEQAYEELVVVFNTDQPARMGPAADDFMQGLRDNRFTLEPDEDMLEHFGNMVAVDRRGYKVPTKITHDSPEKIDLGIAAIVAYHRAMWWLQQPEDEDDFAFVFDPATVKVEKPKEATK